MCGNYVAGMLKGGNVEGSPPRVRELLPAFPALRARRGITPACAGITWSLAGFPPPPGDHPRVCGNYRSNSISKHAPRGSPPRVRELPENTTRTNLFKGITPACAGITFVGFKSCKLAQDHPRVCGNYNGNPERTNQREGSPPRVRELLQNFPSPKEFIGITPACAGITRRAPR